MMEIMMNKAGSALVLQPCAERNKLNLLPSFDPESLHQKYTTNSYFYSV